MQSYWFSKQSKINIIYNISVITITITMSIILANFGKYAISDCPFISVVSFPFHNNDDLLWYTICQARKLSVHPACICATYTVCTWSGMNFIKVLWAHNWNIIWILCAVIDSYHPIKSQICTAVVTFAKLLWRDWIIILQVSSKIFFKIWIMNSSSHYEMDSRMLVLWGFGYYASG